MSAFIKVYCFNLGFISLKYSMNNLWSNFQTYNVLYYFQDLYLTAVKFNIIEILSVLSASRWYCRDYIKLIFFK